MPILSDPRRERFAQTLASGMGQVAAYEKAGYKRNHAAASKLAKSAEVQQRVAELQQSMADDIKAAGFDAIKALKDAAEAGLMAARSAAADGEYRALVGGAVEALKLVEVLSGGVSDRTETKASGAIDEIEGRLARLAAEGRAGSDSPKPH